MITVALITTRFIRQGPNKQLLYLIRNIDKTKVKPIIVTISPERDPSIIESFEAENIEIIQLGLSFWASLFKGRKIINELISSKKINIVHSFTYALRVEFILYQLKNIIKIASVRNSPKQSSSGYFGSFLGIFLYQLKKMMYHHFNKIIACSKSIGELPELRLYDKVIIQNGIDTSVISSALLEKNKILIKEKLKLPKNKLVFITISNGTPIKNIEFLINYFIKYSDKYLVVAGNKNKHYIELASDSDNILFTDHIDNINDYYQAADFFISASYLEGLPNAVLESLLAGTPCILSDIPMHKEIINHSVDFVGLIFQNNDFIDLSNKIEALKNGVGNGTSKKCSQFILDNFSAKRMAKQHEELYLSFFS